MDRLPVIRWALLILLLVLPFSYSHGKSLDLGTVRIMCWGLPEQPTPISRGVLWPDIEQRLWRGLIQLDGQNEVVPDIARRWEISEDGLVYTFFLRNDVLWDDGTQLTANDVVFTFNAWKDPRNFIRRYRISKWVESIEAIDDYTVRIILKEPVSWFLPWLWFGIAPEHAFKGKDPFIVDDQRRIPGNGSFRIKEFVHDQFLTLEASPTYYGSRPHIQRLVFIPSKSSFLLPLKSGYADIGQVSNMDIPALSGTDIRVVEYPASDMKTLRFNMSNSIWEDRRLRQALSKLIDRDTFVKAVRFGHGEPGYHFFQNTWAEEAIKGAKVHGYDPKFAQQLLQEAGWQKGPDGFYANQDGKRLSFTLLPWWGALSAGHEAMMVKEQLRQHGIEVILVDKKWDDPSVDAILAQPMGLYDPVGELYHSFHSNPAGLGADKSRYHNPEVDRILDQLKTTMDRKEKINILPALQNAFYEDPPEVYLFYFTGALGVHKSLQGMKQKVLAHWGLGFLWDLEEWRLEEVK
jgi:peptide/nickel transport system substrate-binding protein